MSDTKQQLHSPLPWRSVYPLGSKQRCAAVSAGDHYVYLFVAQADDRRETIEMHQANADLIVRAVTNELAASRAPDPVAEGLAKALEALVSASLFFDVDDDLWWCIKCNAQAGLGEEVEHVPNCAVGQARAALAKYREAVK